VAAAVTRNEKCLCFSRYFYLCLYYEAVIASHCAASMTECFLNYVVESICKESAVT